MSPVPYYEDKQHVVYLGRCGEILPVLDLSRSTLVVADPPYGVNERTQRGKLGRSIKATARDFAPIVGDDSRFDPSPLLEMFDRLVLWGANYYADKLPISSSWLVWDKRGDIPSNDNADVELAWTNLGGPARRFTHVWNGMIRDSERQDVHVHPTQKPVELMEWIVGWRTSPGDLVIDPYAGSGPVAEACAKLGRRSISIECVEQYAKEIVNRLRQGILFPGATQPPDKERR